MLKVESCEALKKQITVWRAAGERIGFVPTMGALHQGHLSLLGIAGKHSSKQVVSVFVNPTQFNSPEDFEKYPRNLEADERMLEEAGAALLFAPAVDEIYSREPQISLSPGPMAQKHEGEFRPGHFSGVLTVVSILFNLVQPDISVFGEKDFQQLRLIEKLVAELKFPLQIVRAPTVREAGGLALSSRNARLSLQGRRAALAISKGLFAAKELRKTGEQSAMKLLNAVDAVWSKEQALKPEYIRLVDETNLEPVCSAGQSTRLLAAAYVEGVRLIDNLAV